MSKTRSLFLPQLYQDSVESGRLILRDGSTATIQVVQAKDQQSVRSFFDRLSPESRYSRFFSFAAPDENLLKSLCTPDPLRQLSLMVSRNVGGEPRIIAVGSYIVTDEKAAEVAMAVEDVFHGKGLGTHLLERLALLAARNGITQFWATTHATNQPMLEIFRSSGFEVHERRENGYVQVDFSILPTKESVERSEMLDRIFTAASLRPFFKPKSVAVVGASRDSSSIGYRILQALILSGFQGPVYPVNPKATVVGSIRAYPSVEELPEAVDLAVIVVPAQQVLDVVDDCAQRGVKALVVISAGFAEIGAEGQELQGRLLEKVRGYGLRMVGPNCMGIMNSEPTVRLNASFSPVYPLPGRVAMSSQSGALGLAILEFARQRNLGLSTFISVGNKADVSGNDLLQYWEGDEDTDVILLYLESFGNPRRFARIARRVSRLKPIVAVKSGRTLAGKRAAGSHTAALAASDVAVDALFRQTGVIRANTLEEMFDLASALGSQPLPKGRRVGIITNAGGPGILCADMCEANHLIVPELSARTRSKLAKILPPAAGLSNPVDMIASASPEQYRQTIETVLKASEVDAVIVIYIPVVMQLDSMMDAIRKGISSGRAGSGAGKPVFACLMTDKGISTRIELKKECIPTYLFPESAAQVLGKISDYAEWRRQPSGMIPDFENIHPEKSREICRTVLQQRGPGWLSVQETRSVLSAMNLPLPAGGVATTPESAVKLAEQIAFPVAVKLASHSIVHKTEIGGVHLHLANAQEVRRAFERIREKLVSEKREQEMEGVLVQPMLTGGVELMIGVADDPLFGPLIAFGLGGIHVEILGDVCFRVTPLTDHDASEMVRSIRGYRLLEGYRGHAPADIPALQDLLLRISRLVQEVPEISEMDLNPIFAFSPGQGCSIADARIRVKDPGT